MPRTAQQRFLVKRVLQLRENRFTYQSLDLAQSVKFEQVRTLDGPRQRCRVVLTAHGCRVATCTMCPLPDEAVPWGTEVTTANWMRQLRSALPADARADILTLFHNGNFFCDQEVPVERREAVYAWLHTTGVKTLVVECLPQFITKARIEHAATQLGPGIKLEVAIGLQSMDDYLRETVLASPCTGAGFAQALAVLRGHGYGAQVFLMHQMPFLTAEESSVALVDSVRRLASVHGILDPTLCPLRIAPGTVTHELYKQGRLPPASFWHLADVLVQLRRELPFSRARVAFHCDPPDGGEPQPRTDSCDCCRQPLNDWVAAFNVQAEGAPPERCACAPARLDFSSAYAKDDVRQRIDDFLTSRPNPSARCSL